MRAYEFINSVVTDDVLLEILIRLPDARSAIQSATVCQRWRSLILNPDFVRFFTKQHSATMNWNKNAVAFFNFSYRSEVSFHHLSLSQSEYYDPECQPCDLSFMPPPPPPPPACIGKPGILRQHNLWSQNPGACEMVIRACCDDLVLLSSNDIQYFICNWLTKEVVRLPEIPLMGYKTVFRLCGGSVGYALVRNGGGSGYRVLILDKSEFFDNEFSVQPVTFDTETGSWSICLYRIPFKMRNSPPATSWSFTHFFHLEVAVTAGGVLHWLDGVLHFFRLIAFDVFASEPRLIPLPADGGFGEISTLNFRHRVRLGTVQGRLWLSQMTEFHLRIWELDGDDDTWRLVHDVTLRNSKKKKNKFLCVLAFDPNDDNAIFLVRDKEICRYVFDRDKFDRVCAFPQCGDVKTVDGIKDSVAKYLNVFTLVHPSWPSSISPFRDH